MLKAKQKLSSTARINSQQRSNTSFIPSTLVEPTSRFFRHASLNINQYYIFLLPYR